LRAMNLAVVRIMGTNLLTIRIDLHTGEPQNTPRRATAGAQINPPQLPAEADRQGRRRKGVSVTPVSAGHLRVAQDCAVRLSTFPHPHASTAIQWVACAFPQCVHSPCTGGALPRGRCERCRLSPVLGDRFE
jgi:hypothetical protein